jgi:hypothetical protein
MDNGTASTGRLCETNTPFSGMLLSGHGSSREYSQSILCDSLITNQPSIEVNTSIRRKCKLASCAVTRPCQPPRLYAKKRYRQNRSLAHTQHSPHHRMSCPECHKGRVHSSLRRARALTHRHQLGRVRASAVGNQATATDRHPASERMTTTKNTKPIPVRDRQSKHPSTHPHLTPTPTPPHHRRERERERERKEGNPLSVSWACHLP